MNIFISWSGKVSQLNPLGRIGIGAIGVRGGRKEQKTGEYQKALLGYARVSTEEQNLDLQRQALTAAGCEVIHEDRGISGAIVNRPGLDQALRTVQAGDVLTVWKLDRLGRSLPHLIQVIDGLGKAGAGFVSLSENIDTTTAGGRLYFHMMGALAEFERSLIGERTRAGMQAARQRGKHVGRPAGLTEQQIRHARDLRRMGRPVADIADLFGVHRSTVSRAWRESVTG